MAKKNEKQKSTKEVKKDLEDKTFGMKNKKKNREVKKQVDKISIAQSLERKKKKEDDYSHRINLTQPKAPIGVDPKTIPCVYYINKMCDKGDKCKYGHEKKAIIQEEPEVEFQRSKLVCRFLIDSINDGRFFQGWKCPNEKCVDIHELKELGDVEISLEEFIELTRQTLNDNLTPLTEVTFKRWKDKKKKEDELHRQRIKALKDGKSGSELFLERPEMFVDDQDANDVDYNERNYSDEDEDDVTNKISEIQIN